MGTVTISRQLGSLGTQVGHRVGDRLGYRVVWREIINEAARQAGVHEVALAAIDDLGLLKLRPSFSARRAYRGALQKIMEELAAEGNVVIIGRAGQVILGDRSDVLHVRVIAPAELRIERVALRHHIPLQAARLQVEASDRSRRDYLRRDYHVDWNNPELYHLTVNTRRLTVEAVAELVCHAMNEIEHAVGMCSLEGRGHVFG